MATDPRNGLNCTLSYVNGAGVIVSFRIRVSQITHDLKPIFTESSGRNRRAMYPHRMSSADFSISVLVNGQAERSALTQFLGTYTAALLDPSSAAVSPMAVAIPAREFERTGVPLSGMEWGARLGQVVFNPTITFATAAEPLDTDPDPAVSLAPQITAVADSSALYFYPFGTQLSGDQVPGGDITLPQFWGR